MRRVLPKLSQGLFSDPSLDEDLSFDYSEPSLRLFYDTFLNEFRKIYIAQAEISSWFYFWQKSGPAIVISGTLATLRYLDQETRSRATKQIDSAKQVDATLLKRLSQMVGAGLEGWPASNTQELMKRIGDFSMMLSAIYSLYAVHSVGEAQRRARDFMSYFPGQNESIILNNALKNLAEYMTFRLEPLVLSLRDAQQSGSLARHFVKNLTVSLINAPFMEKMTKDLGDQLIQGAFERISKANEALWKRKPCYFYAARDKQLYLVGIDQQTRGVSYETALFNSPLLFVYKKEEGPVLQESYIESRGFGKTDEAMPAQRVLTSKELTHMGFKPRAKL